jgi:lipoprotein-releasing system ATP-binding protein
MSDVIIKVDAIDKRFSDGNLDVNVLRNISLTIKKGEQLAIVGASGSGKSTLLQCLGGLDEPTAGKVYLNGQDFYQLSEKERGLLRNKELGFVYQLHHLLPEFTALENVAMPLLIRKQSSKDAAEQARIILEKVGLGHRVDHKPSELSGGERQRAAIARALVTKPACVLADEPTGNLDSETAEQIIQLFFDLNESLGTSLIVVTHDRKIAKRMQKTAKLVDGVLEYL